MTLLITGYARANSPQKAIALYKEMLALGIKETPHTFSQLLGSCPNAHGMIRHCRAITLGFASNLFVRSALVSLYCPISHWGCSMAAPAEHRSVQFSHVWILRPALHIWVARLLPPKDKIRETHGVGQYVVQLPNREMLLRPMAGWREATPLPHEQGQVGAR